MESQKCSPPLYGVETEYSCLITLPGDVVHEIVGSCHSVDAQLGLYQEPSNRGSSVMGHGVMRKAVESLGMHYNQMGMLSNGGRLYIDPSGPEYATPETTTAEDAVLRSFEGDTILLRVLDYLREEEVINEYQVNRHVVDHNRTSRGIHLNTLTRLSNQEPSEAVRGWLATLNVVKGSLFGSGGLLLDAEGGTEYHHSPRLSVTDRIFAHYGNYRQRPLVRVPFKPDYGRYSRIESITSDALNFGWPLRASLVATNALVGVIELGYGNHLPVLNGESAIASATNVGLNGHDSVIEVESRSGKIQTVNPTDVLTAIVEKALSLHETEGHLDAESVQVLGEIIDTADQIMADAERVADRVESVARELTMQRRMEQKRCGLDAEAICRLDYAWDWIGGGYAEAMRRKGIGWHGFSTLPTHAQTETRLTTPPSDTRAVLRGQAVIDAAGEDGSEWVEISFNGASEEVDPFSTTKSIET